MTFAQEDGEMGKGGVGLTFLTVGQGHTNTMDQHRGTKRCIHMHWGSFAHVTYIYILILMSHLLYDQLQVKHLHHDIVQ